MKRPLIIAISVIVTLTALAYTAGCGTGASTGSSNLSRDKYDSIEVGVSADSVKSIAGEPARTEDKSMSGGHSMGEGSMAGESMNMQYWYYQGDKGWVRLEVADNKVTAKSGY